MVQLAHIPEWEAVQMASAIPAEYLGIGDKLGYIKAGQQASFSLPWWMSVFILPIHSSEEIIFTLYPGIMHNLFVMLPSVKMRYL